MPEFNHYSVMAEETINSLNVRKNGIYVDGTVGGAGHARRVLELLKGTGRFIGIDQDKDAIEAATERLKPFKNAKVIRDNYENMPKVLKDLGIDKVSGILLDLGVSSYQLDTAERGFSYHAEAPLDMRMDDRNETTAHDIVNGYTEEELFRIIRDYGEDRFAKQIARNIVKARETKPIETTTELAEIIKQAVPAKFRENGHPAKQTFQAIRIELNRELTVLSESLDNMIDLLEPGGRLSIITFHSLEDRIVKTAFKKAENPCTCPPSFPVCVCGKKPLGHVITNKPITASEKELSENLRSRSAKLRVFEKI